MLTESYIIHSQKLNNLNTIVYLLTKDFGFIQVFYNKKSHNNTNYKYSKQSVLQPFNNFLVKLNNKKNQITSIEENFECLHQNKFNTKSYFYKSYINELVFLFYKKYKNDPNSIIFESYKKALQKIDKSFDIKDIKITTNEFENNLLKDLGFEINYENIISNNDSKYYKYDIKNNIFTPFEINKINLDNLNIDSEKLTLRCLIDNLVFPKEMIFAIKNKNYYSDTCLYTVKVLNTKVIYYYLGYKQIFSHYCLDKI